MVVNDVEKVGCAELRAVDVAQLSLQIAQMTINHGDTLELHASTMVTMVFHGTPGHHEIPWYTRPPCNTKLHRATREFHGVLGGFHGTPWNTMVVSPATMEFHGKPGHHGIPG